MATIEIALVSICAGGGHVQVTASLNGGAARPIAVDADQIRAPLNTLTAEQQQSLLTGILQIHMMGKTRAQMRTEMESGPVVITI